jgi:hypothetical protein
MKTLNQFYDDALGRALTEVGTRGGQQYAQGCGSDIIMGISPIDFDGKALSNTAQSEDVARRIIGGNGLKSSSHGTAEPEMRGLYILLTLNNEGGMEVPEYATNILYHLNKLFATNACSYLNKLILKGNEAISTNKRVLNRNNAVDYVIE